MKISSWSGGLLETRGYLLETPVGAIVIDAPAGMAAWVASRGQHHVQSVFLTHQHIDHVEDVAALKAQGAQLCAWSARHSDLTLEDLALVWGMKPLAPYEVEHVLKPGLCSGFGQLHVELLHLPGHSPDSVGYYFPANKVLISGDLLFAHGASGRWDLPGGDRHALERSIELVLSTLPPDTEVLPGHGPSFRLGSWRS